MYINFLVYRLLLFYPPILLLPIVICLQDPHRVNGQCVASGATI